VPVAPEEIGLAWTSIHPLVEKGLELRVTNKDGKVRVHVPRKLLEDKEDDIFRLVNESRRARGEQPSECKTGLAALRRELAAVYGVQLVYFAKTKSCWLEIDPLLLSLADSSDFYKAAKKSQK
jgi:hypothetical protein